MFHLIGNAHLDPAWMWPMSEGLEAFAATCRSALDRIEEFPGFTFTCSSAAHYEFVEETDPNLFARIQQAVKEGRWCIAGGWWVEGDCNLPSGESFVRQALLGQRYFHSRFRKIATYGYNVDSFGHNANLPQLMKKSGMQAYIFMRPEQAEKDLPAALFDWEAPSGDRITTYRLPMHYSNHQLSVREKLEGITSYPLYHAHQPWMIFYGVGNHGGGPTIAQLEDIERLRKERGDRIYSDPEKFFSEIIQPLPIVHDEMQPHAIGCYSAHSEIKQLHRRAEQALLQAERFAVLEHLCLRNSSFPYTRQGELLRGWKNVCFNQFHDLLGGVSIPEACDEAISQFREAISIGERLTRVSIQRIASQIDRSRAIEHVIVFNPSAFEREELIEFEMWHPHASEKGEILTSIALHAGNQRIGTQKIEPAGKIGEDRVRFAANVRVPAFGWRAFEIERGREVPLSSTLEVDSEMLSNGIVSCDLSEAISGPSVLSERSVRYVSPIAIEDLSDTWAHGLTAFSHEGIEFKDRITEVIESGPLRAGVRVISSFGSSKLIEEFFVVHGSPVIEVGVFLDWREHHKILRLRYAHGCKDPVARYEIPYASIERPRGPNEWPGQTWVDISERDGSRGLAIITDSKYSFSVDDDHISVIAARSALYAHHVPPHELALTERKRYLDQGEQEFRIWLVPHEGDWRFLSLPQLSERMHLPLLVHLESRHAGHLPQINSEIKVSADTITIGAIKFSEERKGVVVRAVENAGTATNASFELNHTKWSADFGPFEIKSFLIMENAVTEVDLLERPI